MFGLIKKTFIALLRIIGSIVIMAKDSTFTTCISLNNQTWMNRATFINLKSNEYNLGLHYYQFMDNLDRYNGSCNTLDDPFDRICVPNKT